MQATLPVVVGDMATTVVPGQFSLVYLVFNSISNLRTQQEQVECFRNAARHLVPGGRFVIELWIPPLRRLPPGQLAAPFDVSDGHVGFDTYDLTTQQCTSHHYWRERGWDRPLRRGQLPLPLAGGVRPDGSAGRHGARAAVGRLEGQRVHLRQREPHLGLAQALTLTRLRHVWATEAT